MKKLLFGLIATVMLSLNANASNTVKFVNNNSEKEITNAPKIPITIHIEFGRKSKGCTGFGICSMDITVDLEFSALANETGGLDVNFSDKGLARIKEVFGSSTVVIEENFTLSDELCKNLELRSGYTIKAGKYAVQKGADGNYLLKF